MLSSAVSSASNFRRRVSLSSMIWRQAEVRSRTEPFIFDLSPATICLIYDSMFPTRGVIYQTDRKGVLELLINVARYYCVMERDNSSARKSTFITRHIYCKNGGVKWWYTWLNPGVLYIDVTTSGLSKRLTTVHSPGPIIWTFNDLTIYLRASLFFVTLGARKNSPWSRTLLNLSRWSLRLALVTWYFVNKSSSDFSKVLISSDIFALNISGEPAISIRILL